MSGNEKLIREILNEKPQDILRFLGSIVSSTADVEDLFQSGAIRAIEKSGELKDQNKAFSWLLSLYRNLALDFLRSSKKQEHKILKIEKEELENMPEQKESLAKVCGCGEKLLAEIPEQYASLLEEVDMDGASVSSVAEKLKTSPNNVSVRLRRARKSLKRAVKDHCEVETLQQCLDCDCE